MEELMMNVLSNPDTVNKIITELGPHALDNAEHVVVSGIETSGKVLECLVKDGKIVEHTAKTVQDTVKSTETVALSIIETGGKVMEYLIKDGEIVRYPAEIVQLGIKTTEEVVKEIIDKGFIIVDNAVKTTGEVAKEVINKGLSSVDNAVDRTGDTIEKVIDKGLGSVDNAVDKTSDSIGKVVDKGSGSVDNAVNTTGNVLVHGIETVGENTKKMIGTVGSVVKNKNAWNGLIGLLTDAKIYSTNPELGVCKTLVEHVVDKIPKDKKKKRNHNSEDIIRKAYKLNSYLNENFPIAQYPEFGPIKRLLDATVQKNDPDLIAMTIQVISEEVKNMVPRDE